MYRGLLFSKKIAVENNKTEQTRNEFIPHFIILAAFFFLLSQTWLRWGNLVIDTGRELWLPAELLKGKILYKDIVSFYGFLPAYLIASFYKLFGVSINTLAYTGIALTLIVSFTVYRIARFFLDQGFSTLLVINFLFVFAFGHYATSGIFNFILPYTFASTFFMAFTALSLYFFLKLIFSENKKNLLIWSLFLTAAFLCRLESALAVWPGFLLSGFILAVRQPKAERLKLFVYLLLPLFLTVLCYGLFFMSTHTFSTFKETFMGSIKAVGNTPISKEWSGLDNIPSSLSKISTSFLLHIAIFLGIAMSYRIASRSGNEDTASAQTIIPLLVTFLFVMVLKQFYVYELQYRCLTLVLFCGTFVYFFQALNRTSTHRSLGLLTLFTISFLVTYRIFLAPSPYQYGFVLLTLPLICYYIFFTDLLKTALEERFKIPSGLLHAAIAGFLIFMIVPFWKHSSNMYASHDKVTATSRGDIYYYSNEQSDIFWKSVNYLKKNTPGNSAVVVFPEGVGINFFAGRATPLRHHSFMPHDIKLFGEEKILSEIKSAKIDYIVIISRDTGEFGPASFGVDYAKKIQKWIDDNYVPIKQFGAKPYKSTAAGTLILKRKS
jgi:Dolichyl-phosphate-mannose-protein mannosyltransferase